MDVTEVTGGSTRDAVIEDRKQDGAPARGDQDDLAKHIETISVGRQQSERLSGGSIFGSSRSNTHQQKQSLITEIFSGRCNSLDLQGSLPFYYILFSQTFIVNI